MFDRAWVKFVQLLFDGFHATGHAEAVVAITQVAVGLGEHGFGGDDSVSHLEEHEPHLIGFEFHGVRR